jgi:uncharacterized ferredoxin-like protein
MDDLQNAAKTILELMAASARTAPKSAGQDYIDVVIVDKDGCQTIGDEMIRMKEEDNRHNFDRDGKNVKDSAGMLLIGLREHKGLGLELGLECGSCAFKCAEMSTTEGTDFIGPNCNFRVLDMGIALGSAVKTASLHNADNRIMYRAGVAARKLCVISSSYVMGIPISLTGKSPYFDR